MKIAYGNSRMEKKWKNRDISWEDFCKRASSPAVTTETVEEYKKMGKKQQDDIKDVGGFVGGHLKEGRRKSGTVLCRSMLTLDMDYGMAGVVDELEMLFGYQMCIYSTHKHTPEEPRLRLIIPMSREVSEEEYPAVGRMVANGVNYTGVVSNRLNTFQNATIGTLNYNSNSVEPEWSTSTSSYGMFSFSTIGHLNIGEDVETIPASWFRSASLTQEELTLSCGWSYDSFYSDKISIGTLTLTGDMAEITHVNNNNMAFAGNTINTVIYDIPSAVFTAPKSSAYGPFFNADITSFVLTERVEYIDYRLLRDNQMENCYVYAVNASESYKNQTLGATYLPVCTNLYIHYNSDFKTFFSKEVTEYHWLCVDYFDTSYGEKFFDEETGTYSIEIFKTCSVCGYEENDVEELESSYDVYLSILVEIPLAFDSEKKAYVGIGEVYAYGTLGNAYQGIRLVVDKNAESYGKAAMGEDIYDVSNYLTVGFGDSEETVFETGVLSDNATCVAAGQMDLIVKSQMEVSVSGIAFLESGAGEYQISIPLRFELVK